MSETLQNFIVEKGWPVGKRTGYADGVHIHDAVTWSRFLHVEVVPLDEEYAIVIYNRWDDDNILAEVSAKYPDAYFGYNLSAVRMFGALLKREGDALLTLQYDVPLDISFTNSYREGLVAKRLNTTDIAYGYLRWCYTNADTGVYGRAATQVVRRVGETLEVVGTHMFWSVFDGSWWWPEYEQNVWDIVPLTENRYVVLGMGMKRAADVDLFNRLGATWNPAVNDSPSRPYAAWVVEVQGNQLQAGPEHIVGTEEAQWSTMQGAAISENRIVVESDLETRLQFKAAAEVVPGGFHHIGGMHIRTLDIDGLTITENKHNGAYLPDLYTDSYPYYSRPTVVMLNDTVGALIFLREADIQPQFRRRMKEGSTDTRDPANYDPPSLSHRATFFDGFDAAGNVMGWPAFPGVPQHPCALRFSVDEWGAITPWPKIHVLDASMMRVFDQKARELGQNGGAAGGLIVQLDATSHKGMAFVTWGSDQDGSNLPRHWDDPLGYAEKGTWLILDDNSPSGFKPTGFRHLSVTPVWTQGTTSALRPKFFPNTDYLVGTPCWDGTHGEFITDGPGLSPEYYQGFPEPSTETNSYWGSTRQGFYPVHAPVSTYNSALGAYEYSHPSPYALTLAWDDWEETGQKHKGRGPIYQTDPWTFPYGQPKAADGYQLYPDDYVDVMIWEVKPPPTEISGLQVDVKVRPNGKSYV